jgi:hypothetical protein
LIWPAEDAYGTVFGGAVTEWDARASGGPDFLSNLHSAELDRRKFSEYSLNPDHPHSSAAHLLLAAGSGDREQLHNYRQLSPGSSDSDRITAVLYAFEVKT